ncbi:MAG: hypothetical protein JO154_12440 [Chitinophaga sp.]|uniref:hypothetical protein n=1 Tax=Chitinophaga sp. TaxID=1869181 RepID=UPI0025BA1B40|nr:hypothetical protein [Chitinophaga sp.]MBV8253408.1 hypothetical protein [Chitinophaga sp.]
MKKKQINLEKKLTLKKMPIASMVQQPEQILGGAALMSQPNTLCATINYTICNTVCLGHSCA